MVALPTDPQFWDYLFSASLIGGWNLIVYEQDWLFTAVERLPELQVFPMYIIAIHSLAWIGVGTMQGARRASVSPDFGVTSILHRNIRNCVLIMYSVSSTEQLPMPFMHT